MSALGSSLRNATGNNGSASSNSAPSAPKPTTTSQQPAKAANPEEGKQFVKYAYGSKIGDDVYELFATGKISSDLSNFVVAVLTKAPDLQKEIYTAYARKYSKKPVKKFIDPSKSPITKIYDNYDDAEKSGVAAPLKVWLYAEPENGVYERITDQKTINELEGK
jgi:hypothetical protein